MSVSLYLHLPFCRTHCTYCAFAISTDVSQQDAYTEALLREIGGGQAILPVSSREDYERTGRIACPPQVDTIYFGGGTPSRMSLDNLERIVAAIRQHFTVPPGVEFSMEANPEDITPESIAAWKNLGVNRLSIGVQSFQDDELMPLGRLHGADQARTAVSLAVASGIRTNLDLILGLPGQTAASFARTLDVALALGVGHISLYMLDIEEKSPLQIQLSRGRVTLPDDEIVSDLYVMAIERLGAAGLRQYEISNFARPGEECLHNLRYWTRGQYHGFGMGAHSLIGDRRFANTRDIHRYIELSPHATDFSETLGSEEKRRESLFLGLRQTIGMEYGDFRLLSGQEGDAWMERGLRDGWLVNTDGRVAFTASGFLVSNELISQLF